jgi:Flp pilus assembly CpaF family ATPase
MKPTANITIFDPDTIIDNAIGENGSLASSGIPHVIVIGGGLGAGKTTLLN